MWVSRAKSCRRAGGRPAALEIEGFPAFFLDFRPFRAVFGAFSTGLGRPREALSAEKGGSEAFERAEEPARHERSGDLDEWQLSEADG